MKVIFVSAYFEIECQLIAKIMNYSLNLDFLFPFFAEYFIKPNIFFNTYSLFYRGYRFHFNQPNWDHQDEVLVPCSPGWLSNKYGSKFYDARPLFFGAVIDRISYSNHYKNYSVLVPLFYGVVVDSE